MHGESTYTQDWTRGACHIVIGSESHGISAELATYISHPVTIPRVGMAESLNAGIATGILLDTMTR
jgi:TrmH family RNA methyltransferase